MAVIEQRINKTYAFDVEEVKKALGIPDGEEIICAEKREKPGLVGAYEIRLETKEVKKQ
jgi:hypothetical protein